MAADDAVSPVPFFAFLWLQVGLMLFIQQWIVGFDEFMKVQASGARHADVSVVIRIVLNLKSFGFDLQFDIIPLHVFRREENTLSCLVGTRKRLRKLKYTIVAILRHIQFV